MPVNKLFPIKDLRASFFSFLIFISFPFKLHPLNSNVGVFKKSWNIPRSKGLNPSAMKYYPLVFLLSLFLLPGCSLYKKPVIKLSPSDPVSVDIISFLAGQENKVFQFYANGKITIKGWVLGQSASIFIAGKKNPLRIKIEITHSWGKPVLYFLIKNDQLEVLDFNDKKIYSGKFSSESLSRFFPGKGYNKEIIWGILRGYPAFNSLDQWGLITPNRIKLINKNASVMSEVELSPDMKNPKKISHLIKGMNIVFTDFSKTNNTHYAKKVTLEDVSSGKDLILIKNRVVFNKKIPEEVFIMELPKNFERLSLDG